MAQMQPQQQSHYHQPHIGVQQQQPTQQPPPLQQSLSHQNGPTDPADIEQQR